MDTKEKQTRKRKLKNIFTFRFPGKKTKEKKTNANLFSLKLQENSYWFCLSSSCLYNKQLLPQNNSIHNFDSFFFITHNNFLLFFQSVSLSVKLSYKIMFWPKKKLRKKNTSNKGTAFPKRDLCCWKLWIFSLILWVCL